MNNPFRLSAHGLPLENRESIGRDGWIHIVPKGELPHAESGFTQVLDEPALDSILAHLLNSSDRGGLYMGEEHFIYDDKKSSEAFAWAKEFQKRNDGIWARPEYTDIGATALRNKRFKFTSFVCDPNQPGAVERLDAKRLRILSIHTVGFTNFPNGRHLLMPISNRAENKKENQTQILSEIADAGVKSPAVAKYLAEKLGLVASPSERRSLLSMIDPDRSTPSIEKRFSEKLKGRADEIKSKSPNRSFSDCWNQARQEINGL